MTATTTTTKNSITLQGSAEMIREFFFYGISNILYQRGIYPADSFKRTQKYGLGILLPSDEKLTQFLNPLLEQIKCWLAKKELQRLVVVISDIQNKEVVERWQFDIKTDPDINEEGQGPKTKQKSDKKIRQEISDVIRQITASVTFLPLLECQCSFDVLIYTGKDSDAPSGWAESGPCMIQNSQEVKFRSFSTSVHDVETKVCFKNEEIRGLHPPHT